MQLFFTKTSLSLSDMSDIHVVSNVARWWATQFNVQVSTLDFNTTTTQKLCLFPKISVQNKISIETFFDRNQDLSLSNFLKV